MKKCRIEKSKPVLHVILRAESNEHIYLALFLILILLTFLMTSYMKAQQKLKILKQ